MLQTERCVVTPIQVEDYELAKALYTSEQVRAYLGGVVAEEVIEQLFPQIVAKANDGYIQVIRVKETNEAIGIISLDTHHDGKSTEVSYQFLPSSWGKGYAKEVVKAVIQYAFTERNEPYLVAETQSANEASCRLLERVGMTVSDTLERFGAKQTIYKINK
ncbi:GNAT family N-acetyltransferase [Metabacillus iocasae]|uniref:Ribosomal-protein-alanine N-acetyltransferase n=1 Tax=Priestia iocasae TaxID=2291674 RepID=A0ABS2QTQ4_9BACI|nr:GNAT family N-acetyltransferase [Metabacillus iocasae]MBM7702785.1 ribosomal-protein-alanine N-acetyltransferase [Metabacillus iocasae]